MKKLQYLRIKFVLILVSPWLEFYSNIDQIDYGRIVTKSITELKAVTNDLKLVAQINIIIRSFVLCFTLAQAVIGQKITESPKFGEG